MPSLRLAFCHSSLIFAQTKKQRNIMNRKNVSMTVAAWLAGSLLFSSCIGSFKLTNGLLSWNRSLDNKLVNELVFVAFCIVPVYGVSILADTLVLNTIEFWSGDNPISSMPETQTVESENGQYTIRTQPNGYHIRKEGGTEGIDLVFDKADRTWSVVSGDQSHRLFRFTEKCDEVGMYLPDGREMNVEVSRAGTLAFRQAVEKLTYFAAN